MDGSALEKLITQARRRSVLNLIFNQSTQALTLALAAAVVLLIAGTQILNWIWPVALFVAAFAYGLFRVSKRMPEPYSVAQKIDRDLALNDSLSTAWHFRLTDEDVFSAEVKATQRAQAEQKAAKIAPQAAIPLIWPKSLKWCALLALATAGMFMLRYGVQRSLDLSRPLVTFNLDTFGSGSVKQEATNRKTPPTPMDDFMKSISVQPPEKIDEKGLDPAPDSALGTVDVPDVDNENAKGSSKETDQKGPGAGDSNENADGSEQGEGASSGDPKAGDNQNSGKSDDAKGQNQQNAKNQQAPQPGENSSLMDKMKNALANMMSKLNQPNKQQGEQSQQPQNAKGGQPSGNARQQQSAKQGMQSKGQQGADQQQQAANQQGNQDMQESDPSQSAQGKPGDRNSQSASNQENKSGMGKQDGDKDVKMAEQLAAMGKISEIIGKRNEKLQGEIMVEVNSSKQSLRTQYTQRNAKHGESGGEIHRDEVPLIFQNYVQQYFEQVRKAPNPAPAAQSKQPVPTKPFAAETP